MKIFIVNIIIMMSYTELSEKVSKELHKNLLREPDKNMLICSRRILGSKEKTSLPLSFELLLMDNSPEKILQEILEFYCKASALHYEMQQEIPIKRKSSDKGHKTKKMKI